MMTDENEIKVFRLNRVIFILHILLCFSIISLCVVDDVCSFANAKFVVVHIENDLKYYSYALLKTEDYVVI
jgi:hypothetical protein